jgi:formate dehydrogenase subunit gamma
MSAYRIGGAIAALALAVLLIIVTVRWAGYSGMVQPTVNVSAKAPTAPTTGQAATNAQASSSAMAILSARTRLQEDEVNKPPAAYPRLAGEPTLAFQPGVPNSAQLARTWQQVGADRELLTPPREIFGLSSLPYRNAGLLEQPEGRDWRKQHNDPLRFGGGWLIFGVGLALALFLAARGRVRIAEGRSDDSIVRFSAIERANHWMTASAFILIALTGLVILYGRPLLLPLIGEGGLGQLAWWSAWLHMGAAVPFVIGIVIMAVLWLRENLITRLDIEWLKQFGGFLHDDPDKPSARRFNAGQKLVFWGVVLGGLAALASGIVLMVPFYWFGFDGMQWVQLLHAVIGLAMVALILGHIYIGTVGMEGAISAMWSGRVDRNWAKEHHDLWYDEVTGDRRRQSATPAE